MTFIKKKPLYLNLQDFKILHLILTEREIEDREDNLTPQVREIELAQKIARIISNIERADSYREKRRAEFSDQLVNQTERMRSNRRP